MLTTYKPNIEDLWFKQTMLSDEETMSYNRNYGGAIPFPKEKWEEWHNRWLNNKDNKKYYSYLKDESNNFVGEISYHYDEELKVYICDVLIYSKYRYKGYGREALNIICNIAKDNNIKEIYDNIDNDNVVALYLYLSSGFKQVSIRKNTTLVKKEL